MDKELILEAKPKYVKSLKLFYWVSITCFFSIFPILLICNFSPNIVRNFLSNQQMLVNGLIIYLIFIILITVLLLYFEMKNYEFTSYKTYHDRIEFWEGFINHEYTTIKMEDIKEIHYSQNFFQRIFGIGTIKFITAANNSASSTGVAFVDVENSNYIYTKIKQVYENK